MAFTIGLRFRRGDARALQELVDRWRGEGLHSEAIALFSRAAEDARIGEPMRVICDSPEEAKIFADGFVLYGIARPAIEALQS